jgi:hypothetical protein
MLKTGKEPDAIDLQAEGGGRYKGTATFGQGIWDVTATTGRTEIEWEARKRITYMVGEVEGMATLAMARKVGVPKKLTLTEQASGIYKGTALVSQGFKVELYDVTARIDGD